VLGSGQPQPPLTEAALQLPATSTSPGKSSTGVEGKTAWIGVIRGADKKGKGGVV